MVWLLGIFLLWIVYVVTDSSSHKNKSDIKKTGSELNKEIDALERIALDPRMTRARRVRELERLAIAERTEKLRLLEYSAKVQVDENSRNLDQDSGVSITRVVEESSTPSTQRALKTKPCVASHFNAFGVYSLWHITHRNNIPTILEKGILSNQLASVEADPTDISDPDVQRRRNRVDPFNNRPVHNYSPLYVNPRNAMLYVRGNIQKDLCIVEISLSVLEGGNFVFTDGNAASRDTKFYNDVSDLSLLPWDVINASYWNEFADGKRKRCSEVLIYPKVEPKHILRVHCYSRETLKILGAYKCDSLISERMFF